MVVVDVAFAAQFEIAVLDEEPSQGGEFFNCPGRVALIETERAGDAHHARFRIAIGGRVKRREQDCHAQLTSGQFIAGGERLDEQELVAQRGKGALLRVLKHVCRARLAHGWPPLKRTQMPPMTPKAAANRATFGPR